MLWLNLKNRKSAGLGGLIKSQVIENRVASRIQWKGPVQRNAYIQSLFYLLSGKGFLRIWADRLVGMKKIKE